MICRYETIGRTPEGSGRYETIGRTPEGSGRYETIRRTLATTSFAIVFALPSAARATENADAQAEALFNAGKQLREAGQYPAACARFAQSKELAPGVGISLHLADCYERLGKTASAWQEFHTAEKLARERDDAKRAETAHNRAQALEQKLNRLTVEVPPGSRAGGAAVQVDGSPIPADAWNVPLAVDPGDHTVAFALPGQAVRTFPAHVDSAAPLATVRVASTAAPDAPPVVADPAAVVPAEPASAATASASTPAPSSGAPRWISYTLAGIGLVGIGTGALLLAEANNQPQTGCTAPSPDPDLTTGAIIAFSVGGAALVSALVVYFTAPHQAPKEAALAITPAPLRGGGGLFARATF